MTHRRTHDEHVALFAAFAARIAALPPSAWSNIEARCAELSDPSFRALLARAALSAKPHQLWLPEAVRNRGRIRAIKSVSDAVQHGLAFTFEVLAEFGTRADAVAEVDRLAAGLAKRRQREGNSSTVAYVEAVLRINEALAERVELPGIATAVRAAGAAVLRHDWLAPAEFDRIYRYVAPEIPFDSLEPPAAGSRHA